MIQRLKWNKTDIGFSTLDNIDTTSVSDAVTALHKADAMLHQRGFKVVSMLVKAISKPIGASDKYGFLEIVK